MRDRTDVSEEEKEDVRGVNRARRERERSLIAGACKTGCLLLLLLRHRRRRRLAATLSDETTGVRTELLSPLLRVGGVAPGENLEKEGGRSERDSFSPSTLSAND